MRFSRSSLHKSHSASAVAPSGPRSLLEMSNARSVADDARSFENCAAASAAAWLPRSSNVVRLVMDRAAFASAAAPSSPSPFPRSLSDTIFFRGPSAPRACARASAGSRTCTRRCAGRCPDQSCKVATAQVVHFPVAKEMDDAVLVTHPSSLSTTDEGASRGHDLRRPAALFLLGRHSSSPASSARSRMTTP